METESNPSRQPEQTTASPETAGLADLASKVEVPSPEQRSTHAAQAERDRQDRLREARARVNGDAATPSETESSPQQELQAKLAVIQQHMLTEGRASDLYGQQGALVQGFMDGDPLIADKYNRNQAELSQSELTTTAIADLEIGLTSLGVETEEAKRILSQAQAIRDQRPSDHVTFELAFRREIDGAVSASLQASMEPKSR